MIKVGLVGCGRIPKKHSDILGKKKEKPYRVHSCCKTVHSKGFYLLLNCKTEENTFHRFHPIKSAHD